MPVDPYSFLFAFGGGIIGAAVGGLPAFVLCGLAVITGTIVTAAGGDTTLLYQLAWGPFIGPHVTFSGAVAATAYAAHKGKLSTGRDVLTPLMGLNSPAVLLVGGIFGLLGQLMLGGLLLIPEVNGLSSTNTMALAIVFTGIMVRFIWGKTGLWGQIIPPSRRFQPADEAEALPWHSRPGQVLLIGVGFSLPPVYLACYFPQYQGFFFGLAAFSLIFLSFGGKVPVTHHIVLSAEVFALHSKDIGWGLAAGLLAAFLAEIFACLFLIHGDTHIDPPAAALVVTYTLLPLISLTGVFFWGGIGSLVLAAVIGAAGTLILIHFRSARKL